MTDTNFSTLAEKPEHYKETLQLIEKSFSYSDENSFEMDFAPLVHEENHENCHLFIKNDKVIGHIGIRKVSFGDKNSTFPLIMMGGICICEKERGKGYFKTFFEHVYNQYKEKTGLFALWSNKEDFYAKFGFHQAGGQIIVESNGNPTGPTEGPFRFSELGMEDISLMMMIYEDFAADKWTIQRDMGDWEVLKILIAAKFILFLHDLNLMVTSFLTKAKIFRMSPMKSFSTKVSMSNIKTTYPQSRPGFQRG